MLVLIHAQIAQVNTKYRDIRNMELTTLSYLILFSSVLIKDTNACADQEVFQSVIDRLDFADYNVLTGFLAMVF